MPFLAAVCAVAVIPACQTFSCTPTAVYDGDGPIWCAEGPRIRLAGVAPREMDGTCRSNQPCPKVSAERSRNELVKLVGVAIGRKLAINWQRLPARVSGLPFNGDEILLAVPHVIGAALGVTARRSTLITHTPFT